MTRKSLALPTNSKFSTRYIRLKHVNKSQAVWMVRCCPSTLGFSLTICKISMTSIIIVSSLVTKRISHLLLQSQVLNFEINDFKFPFILVWGYEFHAIKVLPHPLYLKHYPPPPPWFFTTRRRVEEHFSTPWFRKMNFNLIPLPDSSTHPID